MVSTFNNFTLKSNLNQYLGFSGSVKGVNISNLVLLMLTRVVF